MNKIKELYDDEQMNVLYTAFHNAADATFDESGKLYDYLENAPRASLTVEIVNEINKLGYKIVKE